MVIKYSIGKLLYKILLWIFMCFCGIILIKLAQVVYLIIGFSLLSIGSYFLFKDLVRLFDRKDKLVLSENGLKVFNHFHTWNNFGSHQIIKYGNRFPSYTLMIYIIDKADTEYKLDLSLMNVKHKELDNEITKYYERHKNLLYH